MAAATWQSCLSNVLLCMLIAGMAGSCDARLFMKKFKAPKGMLAALFSQFVLLPAVGFASVTLLPQDAVTVVTLLVVTTSPGGGFSGWWCSLCNADLALSVAMTSASTLACLIALPLNLFIYVQCMYRTEVALDWSVLLLSVANVVAAVGLGLWAGARLPSQRGRINTAGQMAGVALMGLGFVASSASHDPIWNNPPSWFAAARTMALAPIPAPAPAPAPAPSSSPSSSPNPQPSPSPGSPRCACRAS